MRGYRVTTPPSLSPATHKEENPYLALPTMPLLFLSMPQSAPPCLSILWDSLAFPGMPCHYLRFTAFPHHIPCHSLQFPAIPSHSLPLSAVPCHFLLSPVVPCHSLQSPTLPSCYLPFLGIPHHSLPLPALPCSSPPFSAITSHSLLFPAISFYPLWFPAIPPHFLPPDDKENQVLCSLPPLSVSQKWGIRGGIVLAGGWQ